MTAERRGDEGQEPVIVAALQLVLAEKRTALAVTRTGIAMFAVPMGVLSLLVATSRYYTIADTLHFMAPLLFLCVVLGILATYLIQRSLRRIRRFDRLMLEMSEGHDAIRRLVE